METEAFRRKFGICKSSSEELDLKHSAKLDKTKFSGESQCDDHDCQTSVLTFKQANSSSQKIFEGHSLEAEKALSATPVHPEALQALFITYVASCFVERAWRFGLPAVLSPLCRNLQPVAVIGFIGQFVIFAGGPIVGAFMDSVPRGIAFNFFSIAQMISMLISAAMVLYALCRGTACTSIASGFLLQPWFIILVLAGAIERLTGLATGVAAERDWVVLLAGSDRSIALANANAVLRRVDLVCEIIGPFLFGILLSRYKPVVCILIACAAAVGSIPIVLFLVWQTFKLSKGALDRPAHVNAELTSFLKNLTGIETLKQGWIQYLAQPVLPASIAYVLLYFNTVLAPSGLMTSFLTHRGLNPSVIGLYRGMCAFMGFLATFFAAILITKVGVLKAGALALTLQAALLSLAVLVYLTASTGNQVSLLIFLVLVVLSRLGHWAYDLIDAQIFQTAVPTSKANLVGTTEMSLASLAELLMLGVAILAS
eukprot:c25035_g1_i2 orf=1-1449(-)